MSDKAIFRILTLDGGGAKGLYSLGVILELEKATKRPSHKSFDLIYGTSTGAIIAAALGIGMSADDIIAKYKDLIPKTLNRFTSGARGQALSNTLRQIFEDKRFDSFLTGVGLVASNVTSAEPLVFKSQASYAHGRTATFEPGFGCTIVDALEASCSAVPFFPEKVLTTKTHGKIRTMDGGFVANNPSLLALIDALRAATVEPSAIRVLSVGVGSYPTTYPKTATLQILRHCTSINLIQKQFNISSNTIERIYSILSKDITTLRVNDTYNRPDQGTSMLECDPEKLETLISLGRKSFGDREQAILALVS